MSLSAKILIVEDEILIADYIKELLQSAHFTSIEMAHDAETALQQIENFVPDIILMDINLKGKNTGIDLAKKKNKDAALIFLTGQNDPSLMQKALESSPEAYLTKPVKKSDLIAAIQLQIFKHQLNYVTIKVGYDTVKINLEEVLFIKSDSNYLDIQLLDRKYNPIWRSWPALPLSKHSESQLSAFPHAHRKPSHRSEQSMPFAVPDPAS